MAKPKTDPAILSLRYAENEAARLCSPALLPGHLLLGILQVRSDFGYSILIELGVNAEQLRAEVERLVAGDRDLTASENSLPRSEEFQAALRNAQDEFGYSYVGTEHLLLGAIAAADAPLDEVLRSRGITLERAREKLVFAEASQQLKDIPCERCGKPATVHHTVTTVSHGPSGIVGRFLRAISGGFPTPGSQTTTQHLCHECSINSGDTY